MERDGVMERDGIIEIDNARITFRNFRGEERRPYNEAGDRNFNLVLTKDQADMLLAEGFKVKERPPRDPDGDSQYLLEVKVNYNNPNRMPRVFKIGKNKKVPLSAATIGELDFVEIKYIDLTIRAYHWSMAGGRSGVKAYLHTMYVTTIEDPYEDKYPDVSE